MDANQTTPSTSEIEAYLLYDFLNLTNALHGDESSSAKWSKALITAYTEPQRHYHTVSHINSMLQYLSQLSQIPGQQITNPTAITLAIFFHDWVYDPRANDNEVQSIAVFRDFVKDVQPPEGLSKIVEHYIEATISHSLGEVDENDEELKLFLDLDMVTLGREKEGYEKYKEEIRREYGHLSQKEYCEGRAEVLKRFLESERLYFSEWGFDKFEVRARENLTGEIEELERELATSEE